MLISQSRFLAEKSIQVTDDGNSYLARKLALYALPNKLDDKDDRPLTGEAERALRYACKKDSFMSHVSHSFIHSLVSNKVEIWGHILDLQTGLEIEREESPIEKLFQDKEEIIRRKYNFLLSFVRTSNGSVSCTE